MKLWYQSMTRQTDWSGYARVLQGILNTAKDPGTEIEVHGLTEIGGIGGHQFRYLEYLETGEVLKNVMLAMERGFDAFLIGNIGDPGLREAREIAGFPVLGLCEAALHVSCMMGASFSFVTINEKFAPRIVENVTRYGLKGRMAAISRMDIARIAHLGTAFDDPVIGLQVLAQFNVAAASLVATGGEVVIPAGGVVMALLAHLDVHKTDDGTPILNGITNLVKMGEMAVRLNRLMGGAFTSKRLHYAPPPANQIAELRTYYGKHIYPTVKES